MITGTSRRQFIAEKCDIKAEVPQLKNTGFGTVVLLFAALCIQCICCVARIPFHSGQYHFLFFSSTSPPQCSKQNLQRSLLCTGILKWLI